MNFKLTLLLTTAVAAASAVVAADAVAVERANIIVAQQQQQNENAQQERREQRQQQRQQERQQQRQERQQQAPNAQTKPQPQNNETPKERAARPNNNNQPVNQDRNKPAQQTTQQPKQQNTNTQNKPVTNAPPAPQNAQTKPPASQNTQTKPPPATNQQTTTPATQQPAQQQPAQQQPKTATEPAKPAGNEAARDAGPKRLDAVKAERKETKEGDRTVIRENTRTIIKENNTTIIRHDDTERYRRLGANVQVQRRGNLTENVIVRPGGVRIVERFDERGRLIRRSRIVNGREVVLINNNYRPGADFAFIVHLPPPVIRIPRERYVVEYRQAPRAWIYETLIAPPVEPISQRFTLDEIRYNVVVRERMPRIDIDTINFETGSWEVTPDQAQLLGPIAEAINRAIEKNPDEVYLVEGHTDAVGSEEDNLSLSDRRAEAVAEVLTAQFHVPPENLVTQGYGEQNLKIETQGPEPRNRYVTIRRITPLLAQEASGQAPRQ